MRRFFKLLPVSRLGMIIWAWRNRAGITDWAKFAAGAVSRPWSDVKAELELRVRLRRWPVKVSVRDGVAVIEGRLDSSAHAAARRTAQAAPGIHRVEDRVTTVAPKRRRLGARRALLSH